jgi:BarA-like signal transduction histidine kinase
MLVGCGLLSVQSVHAARYSLLLDPVAMPSAAALQPGSLGQTDPFSSASRWRPVRVAPQLTTDPGAVTGDELEINAFPDTALTAVVDRVNRDILGTRSIRGRIPGYPCGHLLLSSRDGQTLADIVVPELGLHYVIAYAPDLESHFAIDLSDSADGSLNCGVPLSPPTERMMPLETPFDDEAPELGPEDPALVDVMIVYTPAAQTWAATRGGIDHIIAQAMERAQLVLDNSNTQISFRLVHAARVEYTETGDSSEDLRRLTWRKGSAADPDGAMDEIHEWRDAYGADLVALIATMEDAGGRGWLLTSPDGQPHYGFSMTRIQQAATSDTLIHEMAHNLGAHHHREQNVAPGPNAALNNYSAGWRWVGTNNLRYCCTMTYESGVYYADGFTHRRVPYLSNPAQFHTGKAMGDATTADNARTLRETKHKVAGYRFRPLPVHNLSGQVRTPGGTVVSGVSMHGLPGGPTTDEDGHYRAQIPDGWTGEAIPRKTGFVFEPRRRPYASVTQDQSNENYTAWACELGEAVDSPTLSFETGGDADWHCQNAVSLDGVTAAGHGGIFHNQEVWMQCDLEGPGELTFHWKVSSTADADFLEFSVDDEPYDAISGEVDWELRAYPFPVGTRTVRWRYFKDATENSGADRGWVDQVSWVRHWIVSATATPPEGGTVFGDGIYVNGTEALLYVVPNTGYHFMGWGEHGEVLSTEPVLLLTPTADREFIAYFELKQYTLTYTAGLGGSIRGALTQSVLHGQNGTAVEALPDVGYHFVQWSDGFPAAIREDLNLAGDLAVEAQFALDEYVINLTASPPEGGGVFGAGPQLHGTEVSVAAVANTGYTFIGWTEADQELSAETVLRFTAWSARDLVARFELKRYTLVYSARTGGSIQGTLTQTVLHGHHASAVEALPDAGYHFVQWSDGLTAAVREDLNLAGNLAVEAQFALNEYAILATANPPEGGSVFGAGPQTHGTEVSLAAVPNPGYLFIGWREADQELSLETLLEFTATTPRELVAHFELKRYTLVYSARTGGSIQGTLTQTVLHGHHASAVEALPDDGYDFVRWSDGLTAAVREDLNLAGNLAVEAQFALLEYAIIATANPPEGGSVFGAGPRTHGTEVSLAAVPNPGYTFTGWTESDQELSAETVLRFTATSARDLVARFELKRYTLVYSARTGGSIQGTLTQSVLHGHHASAVEALPDDGYRFVQWSDGRSTAMREDLNLAGDLAVEAQFALLEYAILATANPPEGGSVIGAGAQTHGTEVSVAAVPNPGYTFIGWTESDQELSAETVLRFTVTSVRVLVARFELNRYSLAYSAQAGGSIQGALTQSVLHGHSGTAVEALPDEGAVFDRWSDGITTATRQDVGGPTDLAVTATFRSAGGVSVDWYTDHGLVPGNDQIWSDLDLRDDFGKGMTLRDEFIADTDPDNPNSVFRIVAVEPGIPFVIHFEPGSTSRNYTLQSAADLAIGSWTNVAGTGPRPGHGGVDTLTDSNPGPSSFYRILVELP